MEGIGDGELVAYLESREFLESATNSTRLVAKLKLAVQRKELYETHQILRTIYFRFINAEEKIIALKNLLYHGACYLLKLKEEVSGQDIATLFLEAASKSLQNRFSPAVVNNYDMNLSPNESADTVATPKADVNAASADLPNPNAGLAAYLVDSQTLKVDICRKVAHIAVNLSNRSDIGQSKFVVDAFRILNHKLVPRYLLHEIMAYRYWQVKDYVNGKYHYLRSAKLENAKDIAFLLLAHQEESAKTSEVDLFITQFILQYLCLQRPIDAPKSQASNQKSNNANAKSLNSNIISRPRKAIKAIAQEIFSQYTRSHPLLNRAYVPFSSYPLLNFTHFIMSILDDDKEVATFKMLCDVYKVSWGRDPTYASYLTRIGTLYFGIVDQTKQRQGGFFNNIMLSLLEGDEETDQGAEGGNINSILSPYDELD